jgi:NADPH-dependent 2,4-dienoyl-CoA reductase/sulfur reductase-like enzyme
MIVFILLVKRPRRSAANGKEPRRGVNALDLSRTRIVIVGAGQAGARAAEALRAAGHRGPIALVGDEQHPPYERPQLSKAMLINAGEEPRFIRNSQDWAAIDVELSTSSPTVAIDVNRRAIGLSDGREIAFDRLLLATGTRPRRLRELENCGLRVCYLRCIDDARELRRNLGKGTRVVLVGGGVIGLEVASAAIACGCEVTVLEKAEQLLPQVGSPALSEYLRRQHSDRGVAICCNVTVVGATTEGVQLSDGKTVPADLVIVGVGVEPAADLARQTELAVDQGIRVNSSGMTGIDGIYAAGDVAEQWSGWHGRWMRVENWANAQNQAIATARSMAGQDISYEAPPWFWSDQFEANIQVIGHPGGADEIVRGDVARGRFTTISLRDGEVVGAVTVSSAKDMAHLRRLAASRKRVNPADIANPAFDLKQALAS